MYDLLRKKGLINDSVIDKKIMDDWSINNILDFNEQINSLIKPINKISSKELPTYKFTANAELSGQAYGGCIGPNCRIKSIEELSRFAALWADKVYVHSYFDEHEIMSRTSLLTESRIKNFDFRYIYSGSLKCLLRLKKLVESGIVEIVRGEAQLCPRCMAEGISKNEEIQHLVIKYAEELAKEYRKMINAKLIRDKRCEKLGLYFIELEVPEEIDHHKSMMRILHKLPEWLEKRLMNTETNVILGKREMKKLSIPDSEIGGLVMSVLFSQMLSTLQGLNASFLTNSHLEVKLLNYIANSDEGINRNQVLQRELACELPLILGIPLDYLIEIREKEHEAFLVYRDSVRVATNEYISKGSKPEDARKMYEDIILPKLHLLNLQVKTIKDRAWRNLKLDISVIVTCGVFGLLSNMLAMQIPLLAASGVTLVDIAKNIRDGLGTPGEIKESDFYFLWKASKKDVTRR